MASINPHFFPADYDAEAERCVKKLGFVGIKITPIAQRLSSFLQGRVPRIRGLPRAEGAADDPYGKRDSVRRPHQRLPGAKDHPDVTVILAHAGSESFNQQARLLARALDNVFLEPSWCGTNAVKHMIEEVGCDKILFSSDNPDQIPVELAKYRQIVKNEDDLEKVMWKNTNRLFGLHLE
jgi:predicted TIM-barrel fold metal-dependent hydrolase